MKELIGLTLAAYFLGVASMMVAERFDAIPGCIVMREVMEEASINIDGTKIPVEKPSGYARRSKE